MGIDVQDRDIAVLRGLFESRVLSLAHVAAAYFDGKAEAAKKRVQKLKAAGLIRERGRRLPYEPSVLCLTLAGYTYLVKHGLLTEYPPLSRVMFEQRSHVSDLTIRHELQVASVKTAFMAAVGKAPNLSLPEFATWPRLYEFRVFQREGAYGTREVPVKPDGFLRLHEKDPEGDFEHCFFLEVDRSTETQEQVLKKASCYVEYYRSGGFARWMGATPAEANEYPFRVLMVFKSRQRRDNAARGMLANDPPIRTQVWMTTLKEATEDPLGAIWIRPADLAGDGGVRGDGAEDGPRARPLIGDGILVGE